MSKEPAASRSPRSRRSKLSGGSQLTEDQTREEGGPRFESGQMGTDRRVERRSDLTSKREWSDRRKGMSFDTDYTVAPRADPVIFPSSSLSSPSLDTASTSSQCSLATSSTSNRVKPTSSHRTSTTSAFRLPPDAPFSNLVPIVDSPPPRGGQQGSPASERRRSRSRTRSGGKEKQNSSCDEPRADFLPNPPPVPRLPAIPKTDTKLPPSNEDVSELLHLPSSLSIPTSRNSDSSIRPQPPRTQACSHSSHSRKRSWSETSKSQKASDKSLHLKKSLVKLKKSTTSIRNAFRSTTKRVPPPAVPPLPLSETSAACPRNGTGSLDEENRSKSHERSKFPDKSSSTPSESTSRHARPATLTAPCTPLNNTSPKSVFIQSLPTSLTRSTSCRLPNLHSDSSLHPPSPSRTLHITSSCPVNNSPPTPSRRKLRRAASITIPSKPQRSSVPSLPRL